MLVTPALEFDLRHETQLLGRVPERVFDYIEDVASEVIPASAAAGPGLIPVLNRTAVAR
jgi:hypothetical protein